MKNIVYITIVAFLCTVKSFAQYSTIDEVTIESKELDQTREIMIYKPLGYDNPNVLYNVIYVFDAQNRELFDYASSIANISKDKGQGTILVGIKATTIFEEVNGKKTWVYARNSDLLPSDTKRLGGRKGNIEGFYEYVKNEVIPYVESNYKTLPNRMAVGHSLSAGFLVYALTESPELFDNYVAISPNLEFDDQYLLNRLREFDPQKLTSPKHFYMSHADEANWGWGPSNKEAYTLLKDTLDSKNFQVKIEEYPNEGHMSSYIPALRSAMNTYLQEIKPEWKKNLSEKTYEVTFEVKVLNEEDDLYIYGNQDSLANWKNGEIKMKKISPLMRAITLNVQNHVEVQFSTDGENTSWIATGEMSRSTHPMMIRPEEGATYYFEITENTPF